MSASSLCDSHVTGPIQQEVDKLMRQRDKCLEDLRKVTHTKMREAELKPLESDIKILEMRLGHAEKSRDYEVCDPTSRYTRTATHFCDTPS